jgi:solute carrier family 25 protein 38
MAALLQPFDVLRTLQQASLSSTARPGLSATARQLVQQQGVGALWKGLQATLLRVFVGAGIYFVCLDVINRELSNPSIEAALRNLGRSSDTRTLHDSHGPASTSDFNDGSSSRAERHPEPPLDGRPAAHAQLPLPPHQPQSTSLASRGSLQSFIAGAAARSVAATVMNPVAVVKTRMEFAPLGASGYPSALHGVVSIARAEGARGLYRGLAATILRDAPYSGLYFMAYSWSIRRCVVIGALTV